MDNAIVKDETIANRFIAGVFVWMFIGLAISATAIFAFNTYTVCMRLIFVKDHFTSFAWLALLGPFGLSLLIRRGINSIHYLGLIVLFLLYAALIGACFSFILLDFVDASLFGIFAATSIVYGIAAIAGYHSQTNYNQVRPIFRMLVGGILIAIPIVYLLPDLEMQISSTIIGVLICICVSGLRFQEIRESGATLDLNETSSKKMALLQALKLYVDFVNLLFFIIVFIWRRQKAT